MVNFNLSNRTISKAQKGVYKSIICCKCENKTQEYDNYASLILTDHSPNSPEYLVVKRNDCEILYDDIRYSRWENFDFLKFQKFVFVSVLRSHLAEKQNNKFLLIDKHFKKMLSIFEQHEILDDETYPIMVTKFLEEDKLRNHIASPYTNRRDGHHTVEFSGGGYHFSVFVSSHSKPSYVNLIKAKKDGSMYLLHVPFQKFGAYKPSAPSIAKMYEKYDDSYLRKKFNY
ncbi:hypothetical protein KKC52_12860 [bacterium]|nr:hypothetical protein [bacterium]